MPALATNQPMCYDSALLGQVRDFVLSETYAIVPPYYIALDPPAEPTAEKPGLQNKSCGPRHDLLVRWGLKSNQTNKRGRADKHVPQPTMSSTLSHTSQTPYRVPKTPIPSKQIHVKSTVQHSKYFRKPHYKTGARCWNVLEGPSARGDI